MNVVVIDDCDELVAYISDTGPCVIRGGYDIIDYGNNRPVFDSIGGKVYLAEGKFIMTLDEVKE